ncbi:MAG: glutathione S-transferase family protein [Proteobacteria bacterium]|nr:glutathione S-transferase family protein [Pseudomonadota bacterium]MCH9758575.1 glutathione S-transferase family protein [Pseudomonadota bacterium]
MQLVIADKNYSTWSMRPWLLLTAYDVAFEEILESLEPDETLRQRLLQHSPSARVPVLLDGDLCVWDSLAICEYISEHYLNGRGYPQDAKCRAQARAVVAEMHSGFSALRAALPMNCRARRKLPLTAAVLADIQRIDEIWSHYPQQNSTDFLFGDFSIADCFYAPVAMRFLTYADIPLSEKAQQYWQRLCVHPAVVAWQQAALCETSIVHKDEAGEEIK